MCSCWVSYNFGIKFGIIELAVGFLFIIINIHDDYCASFISFIINVRNDYCASFISFCYDDVISVLEFVQRINFTVRKVAACMRFVYILIKYTQTFKNNKTDLNLKFIFIYWFMWYNHHSQDMRYKMLLINIIYIYMFINPTEQVIFKNSNTSSSSPHGTMSRKYVELCKDVISLH